VEKLPYLIIIITHPMKVHDKVTFHHRRLTAQVGRGIFCHPQKISTSVIYHMHIVHRCSPFSWAVWLECGSFHTCWRKLLTAVSSTRQAVLPKCSTIKWKVLSRY